MKKTNKKATSKAIKRSVTVKAAVAKNGKHPTRTRDRQREEDIRISFHNGMLAGLEQVKREIKDVDVAAAVAKIVNRVIAHRDTRMHTSSRWYVGSCRDAIKRSAKKNEK